MMKNATLLLFLSEYKKGSEEKRYTYEDGSSYTAALTSDAPTKCLFKIAEEDGARIRQVLCITSALVKTEEVENGKTRFQLYEELIHELGNGEVPLIAIPYDYKEDGNGKPTETDVRENLSVRIYSEIAKHLASSPGSKEYVYVDYTGGMRDVSFLMTTVIRYLEFSGAECRQIVYSNWKDGKITSIKYIYDMYQLISGVNEFVTTGNVMSLEDFFHTEHQSGMKKLVKSIINFANTMSLCDVGNIDTARDSLRENLLEFESGRPAVGENKNTAEAYENIYEEMLRSLIPLIREKMFLEADDGGMSYINMINWCIHNRMLQQAATLYVEKMPKIYCEQGILEGLVDYRAMEDQPGKTKEPNAFYTELFDKVFEGNLADNSQDASCRLSEMLTDFQNKWEALNQDDFDEKEAELERYINGYPVDGELRQAKKRVRKLIRDRYRYNSPCLIYGESALPKKIETFFTYVQKDKKCRHYFLRNNKQEWDTLRNSGVYEKKLIAVKKLCNESGVIGGWPMEKQKQLGDMMSYYLAVKLLRNRMNHASETEQEKDELDAINGLQREMGIPINENMNFDDIRRLLTEAINVSERALGDEIWRQNN